MTSLREPIRLTSPRGEGDQLLYFTSHSLTADDRHLVFIRTEDGNPNLVTRDLHTGEDRYLTRNTEGWLRSYVYFDGRPYEGLGKASVSLDAERGIVYYLQGREIRAVTLDGQQRTLTRLDSDDVTAFTHISADGRWLCVPTSNKRTLDGPFPDNKPGFNVDQRVQEENLTSRISIYDTITGKLVRQTEITRGWVTHVQFSPDDPNLVLYNHEWAGQAGVRRMWLWDGKFHRRVRTAESGREADDWVCHEMWSRAGSEIIYHGGYTDGACFIGRCDPDIGLFHEIALPDGWRRYGHFTVGNGDWLVTDGYYQQADDPEPPGWGGQWIALLRPDWREQTIEWRPICRHGSGWKTQDDHPHPIFDHAGKTVLFTSDVDGRRNIYRVDAPC